MGRRLLAAVTICLTLAVAVPASAASESSGSQLRVTSVEMSRGAVSIALRARCSGGGFMRWDVGVGQDVGSTDKVRKAKAGGRVSCDGRARVRTADLVPNRGRFHPGSAYLYVSTVGPCTAEVCIGWARGEQVDLTYRR
ncbi:MAG: hypothetical protein OEW53_09335 [Actinomycetota bacterium]|nr:hypothetical protein [Actinomycetota bacterium]